MKMVRTNQIGDVMKERITLNVRFEDKDKVKALGARWDADQKTWYIPLGLETSPFALWIPKNPTFTAISEHIIILKSINLCWKCKTLSPVYGIALDSCEISGEEYDMPILCYYISSISPDALKIIQDIYPKYYSDYTKQSNSKYFLNHCQDCGAKFGDFMMYMEPGGSFCPDDRHSNVKVEYDVKCTATIGCDGYTTL